MKIKTILGILKEFRYLQSILKHYSDSLVAGKYYLHDNFHTMALKDPEVMEKVQQNFRKSTTNSRVKSLIHAFNKIGFFFNRNRDSVGEYDAFYIANNYDEIRELKLFSFKNNRMLTVCTSQSSMEEQLHLYERLSNSYNMPAVKKYDRYTNALEVSMVQWRPFPGDEHALYAIVQSVMRFRIANKKLHSCSGKDLIAFSYNNGEMNELLGSLVKKIDKNILDLQIPLCLQHGDLSKENLIYGEAEGKCAFWWIDWEHVGERVFFYDFFFYIINAAYYGDKTAYECYMGEKCNVILEEFFELFGLIFDKAKKRDYFLLFTVVFFKERLCEKGELQGLKAYIDFLDGEERNSVGED